jgi:hypothetical protein
VLQEKNELKNEQAQNANYTHPNKPPHSVDYTCDGTVKRCIGNVGVSDCRDQGIGNVGVSDQRDQGIGNVGVSDRRDQGIGNVGVSDRRDQDIWNVGDFTRGFLRAKKLGQGKHEEKKLTHRKDERGRGLSKVESR